MIYKEFMRRRDLERIRNLILFSKKTAVNSYINTAFSLYDVFKTNIDEDVTNKSLFEEIQTFENCLGKENALKNCDTLIKELKYLFI